MVSGGGILDVEIWDCIGKILQKQHRQGTHIPVQIFSMWSMVLEPFQENESKKLTVTQCECPMPDALPPPPPREWTETNPF
jgi:hypothetical protein